ncbi:MAG: ATP-binding protein [Peptoniphilus harei]|nr:ATP-binding protein [Peptoniphilus harei]
MNIYDDFKYEYADVPEGFEAEDFYSQKYEDTDRKNVEAIYTPPVSDLDKGNIFIEALPRMRSRERLELDLTKGIDSFNHQEIIRKSPEEQITLLMDLYRIRKPLPTQYSLEGLFSNTLLRVYRSRNYKLVDKSQNFKKENEEDISNMYAYGKVEEAPPAGFSLLGYAGCGKSSMLGAVLSHYPQVIWHDDGINSFPQITYIMTNANSSSRNDFHAVLNDVCRQVDIALGFDDGKYYNKASKLKNYDQKIGFIKQLITRYNVGAIIIDEIQALDFRKNDLETYSKLLQISNETKTAFILSGTESAYGRMFIELHMHRRFPPMIASSYTGNVTFVNLFLRDLFKYQWVEEEIKIPPLGKIDPLWEEIVTAFFECTAGIVALMVGLYEKLNFDYIIKKKKQPIDGKYVRMVFKKYFGTLKTTLDDLDKSFSYEAVTRAIDTSNIKKSEFLSRLEAKREIDKISSQEVINESQLKAQLMQSMQDSIDMCYGDEYTEIQIENACKTIVTRKSSLQKDEKALTREAISLLKSKPRTPKKQMPLPEGLGKILG